MKQIQTSIKTFLQLEENTLYLATFQLGKNASIAMKND